MLDCGLCGNHKLSYISCENPDCPNLQVKMAIEHDITCGMSDQRVSTSSSYEDQSTPASSAVRRSIASAKRCCR